MPNAQTLLRFCNEYWRHPYWKEIEKSGGDPWIRLELLPSKWLLERLRKKKQKVGPLEISLLRSELNELRAEKILGNCDKGFDVYYFCNVVPHTVEGFAKSSDVIQRLWLPVDLDYRLPVEPRELCEELGLDAAFIIETSNRAGHAHHQYLFQLAVTQGPCADEDIERTCAEVSAELCRCLFSDSVTDAKRVLRLPGTLNWKKVEHGGRPCEVKLVESCVECSSYMADEIREAVEAFGPNKLSSELAQLSFKPQRSGGVSQGIKGEYGAWDRAYEEAEAGRAVVNEGGRHNALISWGGQMARGGIAKERIKQNLVFLGQRACAPSYFGQGEGGASEGKDFIRLWSYLSEHVDNIEKEQSFSDDDIGQDEGNEKGAEQIAAPSSSVQTTEGRGDSWSPTVPGGVSKRVSQLFAGSGGRGQGGKTGGTSSGDGGEPRGGALRDCAPKTESGREPLKNGHDTHGLGTDPASTQTGEAVSEEASADSPLLELERELKAAEVLALGKFKGAIGAYLTKEAAGLKRSARLVKAYNAFKKKDGDEVAIVDVFQRAFKDLRCDYGRYFSGVAKVRTLWGAEAKYTVELSEKGLGSVVDHAAIDISKFVRGHQAELSATEELAPFMKAGGGGGKKDDNKKFAVSFPATGSMVRTISDGLKRRVAEEFAGVKAQASSMSVSQNGFYNLAQESFHETQNARYQMAHPLMTNYVKESPREDGAWNRFLRFAFPNDPGTIEALYRMMGYCGTTDTSLQKIFMFEGVTGSGKSTLSGILMSCLGVNNATASMYRQLAEKDSLSQCEGKLFCAIEEAESGDGKIHTECARRLKEASSGQPITIRPLHQNERVVTLPTKFLLLCNKGVQFKDTAGALARRLVTFHFDRRVGESDVVNDVDFRRALLSEADAIMSEAARRLGAVWRQKETMFEGLGSKALEQGRERAMVSLDPVSVVLRQYVSIGVWEDESQRDFAPTRLLSNIVMRHHPELWNAPGGLQGVEKEIVSFMGSESLGGVKFENVRQTIDVAGNFKAKGFRGVKVDFLKAIEDLGKRDLLRGLDRGAFEAIKKFFPECGPFDESDLSTEKIEESDLNT